MAAPQGVSPPRAPRGGDAGEQGHGTRGQRDRSARDSEGGRAPGGGVRPGEHAGRLRHPSSTPSATLSATPSPKATEDTTLRPGDTGPRVAALQQRLTTLGYWNGTADGTYGHVTAQAVLALQKSAGLTRDGMAGPRTMAALEQGVLPTVGPGAPDRVEIDLAKQLLYVVRGG